MYRPRRYQEFEATRLHDIRQMKVVRLSVLHNGSIYTHGDTLVTQFRYRLSRTQGHSVVGRIMSMKIPNLQRSASTNCSTACPLLSILCYQILVTSVLHQVWFIIKISVLYFPCDELLSIRLLSLKYEEFSYRF